MKSTMKQSPVRNPRRSNNPIVTFILAALLILFVILYPGKPEEPPQYDLKIMELGSDAMLAHSDSEELGYGEVLLNYGSDMVIEDVNGQIIEFADLSIEDEIRVSIAPREKDPEYDRYLDPVVEKIILLPDDSNEYV